MPLSPQTPRVFRFGVFEVDSREGELRKSGLRIKLQDQPFQVLVMLLERPGEIVTREELQRRLWPADTFVDFDHSLNSAIKKLREALQEQAENPRFVETVPKRGYRFIAPVETETSPTRRSNVVTRTSSSEETPTGTEVVSPVHGRRARVLALALAAAIVLLIGLTLIRKGELRIGGPSPPRIESLAVLPLVNLSVNQDQDYFADGMTEALITDLGKIGALRVISRTSVMQYKGTKKPLPEIARELNVNAFIEGTVSRSGNHVRITANLLQAFPEKHLWAESYESEIGDILTLQGQVAQAVAREIQVQLTPEQKKLLSKTRPVNPKAHDDYLRGRYLCDQDTIEATNKAIPYFQQAIEEAPTDPLPYAGLAVCYSLWGLGGDIFVGDPSPKESMQTRDAALKAVQLDGDLAEAHTSLAVVAMVLDWNWSTAEREFKSAIELNPNYSLAHLWYAQYLVAMRRFDESVAEAKRSLELDPVSPLTMDLVAWAFHLAHQYDLSIDESRKSLELIPKFPWPHYNLWQTYDETGRASEAVQEFTKAEEGFGMPQNKLAELRSAYRQSGEKGYWRKILSFCQEASRQPRNSTRTSEYGWCDYVQNGDLAAVQARLGQFDAAFGSLERAYANHETVLIYLDVDPRLKYLRSDPRFQDMVRRVGLPQ